MPKINMFIPIRKVNAERREVWGWGAIEETDNSDEILDYESSKPHFLEWSNRAQKRSRGRSLGNVRAMHGNIAAGKLIELRADDVSKGFFVGAKIIDEKEWQKVVSGVYTGFSVGGKYLKRWQDFRNPGKTRYTAQPMELSIVDSPAMRSATFEMIKADGDIEEVKFMPGDGESSLELEVDERLEDESMDIHKVEKGDVMRKLAKIYGMLEEVEDELQKQEVPGAPESIADIPLTGSYGSANVEQMPPPNTLLEIKPDSEPSQQVLAAHAVNSKELSAAMEAWLPKVGVIVKSMVAEALAEATLDLSKTTESVPVRTIPVKNNNRIKVA